MQSRIISNEIYQQLVLGFCIDPTIDSSPLSLSETIWTRCILIY